MKKRVLVIGANSVFAKDLIQVLAHDNTVITAGRNDCDVYCDVSKSVDIPEGIDVVVNVAAAFGGTSDDQIVDAQYTNVNGTINVCLAAKKAGVGHLIILSSLSAVLDESSPYYSIYAITKKHADEIAQFYCKHNGIPLAIVRPSQIFGDSDSFSKHQPFLYQIIDKAQNGQDISIYGKNDALRNYIHSVDLSTVINRIVEKRIEGIYPCMYPIDITYAQIAHTAQKIFDKGGKVVFMEDKPDTPNNVFKQDSSIYERLNYSPKISIEMGIQKIKEYRERGIN